MAQLSLTNLVLHGFGSLRLLDFTSNMRRLVSLEITGSQVCDLSPLTNCPLESLVVSGSMVSDVSPLRRMRLKRLDITNTQVADLSPLSGMEITEIFFSPEHITNGLEAIRNMPSIQAIGDRSWRPLGPKQFWEDYDAGRFRKDRGTGRQ